MPRILILVLVLSFALLSNSALAGGKLEVVSTTFTPPTIIRSGQIVANVVVRQQTQGEAGTCWAKLAAEDFGDIRLEFDSCQVEKVAPGQFKLILKHSIQAPTVSRKYWIHSVGLSRKGVPGFDFGEVGPSTQVNVVGDPALPALELRSHSIKTASGTNDVKFGETIEFHSEFQTTTALVSAGLFYLRDLCSDLGEETATIPLMHKWGMTTDFSVESSSAGVRIKTSILIPSDHPCSKFIEIPELTVMNQSLQVLRLAFPQPIRLNTSL